MEAERILEVQDLETQFRTEEGLVKAVDRVSFVLHRGETLGIVGESGCGKSVTNLSILQLLPARTSRITGGRVLFRGRDLRGATEEEVRVVRGRNISMIFQDPLTSLNPLLRVWVQIAEALRLHQGMGRREARAKAVEMLRIIGIPDAERRANDYPHQFSGGMRQRVMIAMALSCNPDILIADEPTTALDVTIQAQILDLISSLSARNSTAVILITHDLGVVAGMCQTVCVMYAGHIVERAPVDDLFADPLHPYTQGLLASIPRVDRAATAGSGGAGSGGSGGSRRLTTIPGSPPNLIDMPDACPFHPRCPHAMDICRSAFPPQWERPGRAVSCWLYAEEGARVRP